jgi:hypothetical protein
MSWTEGYVSEVNYTSGFYGELSPLKLGLATLIKPFNPPILAKNLPIVNWPVVRVLPRIF